MAKGMIRDKQLEVRWRRIIREHGGSGLTIRAFCRKSKLAESAFYFWRSELQRRILECRQAEQEQRRQSKRSAQAPAASPAFVEVRLAASNAERVEGTSPAGMQRQIGSSAGGRIEIELSGGLRIHVTPPVDRAALADVVAVLSLDLGDSDGLPRVAPIGLPRVIPGGEGRPC